MKRHNLRIPRLSIPYLAAVEFWADLVTFSRRHEIAWELGLRGSSCEVAASVRACVWLRGTTTRRASTPNMLCRAGGNFVVDVCTGVDSKFSGSTYEIVLLLMFMIGVDEESCSASTEKFLVSTF